MERPDPETDDRLYHDLEYFLSQLALTPHAFTTREQRRAWASKAIDIIWNRYNHQSRNDE